jgi:hypothetical protein
MQTNGIVYVTVGGRDLDKLSLSLHSVRKYTDLPIVIWSDTKYNLSNIENVTFRYFDRVKYNCNREENRNSSLFRLKALKESTFTNTLYLDNDITIVDNIFFEGFNIAENFGLTMVENPRQFIKSPFGIGDLDKGLDVVEYDKAFTTDMPNCMMALNMGVMFYNKKSEKFLDELIWEQENNPSRGQAGLYRTIWKTKQVPYALPFQWLVCKKYIGINNPIALHIGHDNIFKWYMDKFI